MPRKNAIPNHLKTILQSPTSTPDQIKDAVNEYIEWLKRCINRQFNTKNLDLENYKTHIIMLDSLKTQVNTLIVKLKRSETRCSILQKK
ncbi:36296_t:CDS:1, partial [Racocetra persica]